MLTFNFIYLNPLLMHLYYFDDGSVGSILFDVALMFTLLGPSTSWTRISLRPWSGPSISWNGIVTLGGRPLCGLVYNFVTWLGPSIMWTGVLTLGGVRPLYGLI